MMQNSFLITNKFLFFAGICSFLPLLFALYYQYFENYPPCELCIYQRVPYILILFCVFFSIIFKKFKKIISISLPMLFLSSLMISSFHFGVEQGFWEYGSKCSNQSEKFNDIDELRNFLYEVPITKCNEILWDFLGISMAGYNMIFSFITFLISIFFLRRIFLW